MFEVKKVLKRSTKMSKLSLATVITKCHKNDFHAHDLVILLLSLTLRLMLVMMIDVAV